MDFYLNFGRLFGFEIDSFRKSGSSENVPPKEIWTPKIMIFSRENAIFYKIDIFKINAKNSQKMLPKSTPNPAQIDNN